MLSSSSNQTTPPSPTWSDVGLVTAGDTPVTAIKAVAATVRHLVFLNEGSVAGFWSIDNWATAHRLPAGPSSFNVESNHQPFNLNAYGVAIRRIAGGSDLSGVFVSAY